MKLPTFAATRMGTALALALLCSGCGSLLPQPVPPPAYYMLATPPRSTTLRPPPENAPTLAVNPLQAAAGYESARILYTRRPQQIETYAQSEWADAPARLLTPMLVTALQDSGAFRAVIALPGAAATDLRLDTELLRLQQDFGGGPSRVHLTLRATLVDTATRRIRATRDFDQTEAAASEDAAGGVAATQRAVQRALAELAAFCAATAR